MERELLESEAKYKEVQHALNFGSWELNHLSGVLHWSDEMHRQFGIERHEFEDSFESLLDHVHPDDREFVRNEFEQSIKTKTQLKLDHRLVSKDGHFMTTPASRSGPSEHFRI